MKLGKLIAKLRKKAGYNQSEFAKECNISRSNLSEIENDHKLFKFVTIEAICEKLDIPEFVVLYLTTDFSKLEEDKRKKMEALKPSFDYVIKDVFGLA